MAIIKCPSCGHRHFQAMPYCINCGAPLSSQEDSVQPVQARDNAVIVPSSTPKPSPRSDGIASYERSNAQTNAQAAEAEGVPAHAVARSPQHEPEPQGTNPSRQLVRREELRPTTRETWKKKTEVQLYEPYETAVSIAAPDPFGQSAVSTVVHEETQAIDPEHWKKDRLPWYFPKIQPNIAGTVIHMETKEEVIDYPDMFAAIVTLLVSLVWVATDTVQDKESDRVVMTTVRVKTDTGQLKDTRLRGNMRGANLSLGDCVSLWGFKRHGVLFINRGFNHTTQGVISTNAVGFLVPALIIVVATLLCIYIAPTWLPILWHHFLSTIGSYFSFLHHHPITPPMQKKK